MEWNFKEQKRMVRTTNEIIRKKLNDFKYLMNADEDVVFDGILYEDLANFNIYKFISQVDDFLYKCVRYEVVRYNAKLPYERLYIEAKYINLIKNIKQMIIKDIIALIIIDDNPIECIIDIDGVSDKYSFVRSNIINIIQLSNISYEITPPEDINVKTFMLFGNKLNTYSLCNDTIIKTIKYLTDKEFTNDDFKISGDRNIFI